jgi:uncharacterized phage protein gp47/JayE
MGGGSDEESDEDLRARIKLAFTGEGAGTQADYKRMVLEYDGVGRVTVVPHFDGPGTVLVIIADAEGQPLPGSKVTEVQNGLDPVSGQGQGDAPIDHDVTVATPTTVAINVAGQITFKHGYSLDGTSGTTPQRSAIVAALTAYVNALDPGGDVVYEAVKAALFTVDSVLDVSGITVEGGTANVAIAQYPPQTAQLAVNGTTDPNLTEVLT